MYVYSVNGMIGQSVVVVALAIGLAASTDKRPHFTTEPPPRVLWPATRGAYVVCRASGHPTPDIHWVTAEGQVLTTIPGLRHVLSDGRLVVGARRSMVDAGGGGSGAFLRCRASNRAGVTLSRPVLLEPVDDSVLAITVMQLTPAKLGGSVVMRCELSLEIGFTAVKWLQDGLPLTTGYMGTDTRWISGAGELLLGSDLTQADVEAEYSCIAIDTPSPTSKLTTDESSWLESVEVNAIVARVGDTAILPCVFRHINRYTITWQRQDPSGVWVTASGDGVIRSGALILPNVRLHHAGRYACSPGTESTPRIIVRLIVNEPLSLTVTPNPLMLGTGGSGHFNCSVSGNGGRRVTICWQHEGRSLHSLQTKLTLGPVRSHHAGLYQCTLYDHSESAVSGAELIIADRPPRLVTTFSEAITRVGQSIALRCAATGIPPPRIFWTLDDIPLPSAPEKYTVNTRAESLPGSEEGSIISTLNINIRTADEGGRYGCNATNSGGSQSHYARLNVFGPPNIRYLPPMHVKVEADVTINCPYSGYPIKEVIWRREDGSIVESPIQSGEERGLLRLTSVRGTTGGGYTCEVRAESGELARRTVRIEVHKPPKIVPFQFPEELEVGGSTQATCSLVSGDKPIQFSWHKDNLPIPSVLKVEQKNMDFFTILVIQDLNSMHSGEYSCRATNDFGTVSHSAALVVKEAPLWVWRAQNTSVSAGAAVLLPCSAKGQPQPRISWEFSTDSENWRHILWGQSETNELSEGSILSDGTVWLRAATPDHEGWYRCTARVQHSFLHHVFFLDVREPPKLSRGSGTGESQWVVRGTPARLTCSVRGEPEIHVHWTHDSRPLALHGSGGVEMRDLGNGAMMSEITITHAGPEHAGDYRCLARNLYGTDELVFRLFVKERPSVPEEVRISEVWSRKARITWRVTRGAIVSHYSLQYRSLARDLTNAPLNAPLPALETWDSLEVLNITLANSDLLHVASEGPSRAGALVSGLYPDTRYVLRIAAHNDVGASPFTTPLQFTTREEAPGGVPRDISLRALRARELLVTWQPPPRESWHGTLLGYTVRWWEASEEGKGSMENASESGASSDATSTTIRGLKPATRYCVTVRAYNAAGNGPTSQPHYRHSLESPPNGSPEGLACVSSGSTSLRVSWRPPALESRGGLITHYTLQYTRRDADPLQPVQDAQLRVQGEETTVSRLTPFAEYDIRVRAHNAAGDGLLSPAQICRTDEDVPSAPSGIKLIALSERALRASWLPPVEPNGRLTHYSLYFKDLAGSQEANLTRVNSCTESEGSPVECMKTLRGLRSGRTYEAWVRAATGAGEGPTSTVVECQTTALAPARISSFGGVAAGTAGSALSLRCVVGGVPPPSKRWLRGGSPLHIRTPFHLDGDALMIRNLELQHADNYTCVAENPHGSDSVTWRVFVLRPPSPPGLALIEARSRELELEIRASPRVPGHAIPKEHTLHWRLAAPEGEWRVQTVSPGPAILSGLRCGSAYRAYGSAGGPPGTEISIRTSGGPPVSPPDNRWIRCNATHAQFDTSMWSDGGCGPVALKLEWAGSGVAGARDVPVGGEVILGGLSPGSRYRVAARASNEAGWTREVYEFTTSPPEGDYAEEVDAPFPATAGELALLLALCAALSVAALTILAILLRRKRTDGAMPRVTTSADKTACGTYRPPHSTPKLLPDPPDVYEISPYATFAGGEGVGPGSRAYTLQLRALARHDDDAAPPPHSTDEETCLDAYEAQRRRRRRRHYCTDHGCSQDSGS
ncbi:Down syndrome cell adhesion molecule-like protein Dscam2 isoform X2 [Pieris brassicae]|uniref:Down syndrome cell adhesion molecule-like protein Dscam2 isoform X2 n=1 Tax=Pieris brassicae TaxID=7116 RepID=UPI001E65F02E|nr:Down syndrome cell adhesion molecule-like protein Dscam2 isoform X2 [Pieris brassicae]